MPRYAAIDIGSNSIRMEAAEVVPGSPTRILASEREVTRLGESVFRTGRISEEAIALNCAVLARMAAIYRALDVIGVRAVATSSVRESRNQAEFLARASEAIGGAGRGGHGPRGGAAGPCRRREPLAASAPARADRRYRRRQRGDHRQARTAASSTPSRSRWAPFACARSFCPRTRPRGASCIRWRTTSASGWPASRTVSEPRAGTASSRLPAPRRPSPAPSMARRARNAARRTVFGPPLRRCGSSTAN